MVQQRPRLAIALGDPAGIGPEVILKALAHGSLDCGVTIFGHRSLLTDCYQQLIDQGAQDCIDPERLMIVDVGESISAHWGQPTVETGAASFCYAKTAIERTLAGEFDAVVTGPIAKSVWKQAGHHYAGQTELLAECARVERFGMMFVARSPHTQWQLRALLATTHIPLAEVPRQLTPGLLSLKLDLLLNCLKDNFGLTAPRIAIAGLNPHSGEQGQLGREEIDWIIPWLEEMRSQHPQITLDGPIPPDTMWVKPGQAWYGPGIDAPHDAYLALYHDQGLIPVKLMAFDRAVNTTIGLPFVRTSPDHGTAFDIAGQGIADATSMRAAIELAIELTAHRQN
ncbi:4-hydroxythreonine-4-phosphate dehydrogenase PdxA [Acaryochloris thomasi]|uniref:4-hydroxythreonine-4-phosphate dehydrogenase PdxA n=1 Tax=Acaryochloris thomasi TaxID=2929456 RepID=UPI001F42B08C